MKPFSIFGIVPPGLEKLAKIELNHLGFANGKIQKGGVEFVAHQNGLYRLNSYARIFSRFLIRFADFHANSFWELEKRCKKLVWEQFLNGQQLDIRVHSYKSKLMHTDAVAERIENAISSRLPIPSKNLTSPTQRILVYIQKDHVQISIDSSGEHLYKRGYRQKLGKAPLRENLAAALVMQVWQNNSLAILWDPFCGTGTIPIEAALWLRNIPWWHFRKFAFQNWPIFQQDRWQEFCAHSQETINTELTTKIIASDISSQAIEWAKENAEHAQVLSNIEFIQQDFSTTSTLLPHTAIIANLPYGKRLHYQDNQAENFSRLNGKIYQLLRENASSSFYFLLPSDALTRFSLPIDKLLKLKHGGISTHFCAYPAQDSITPAQ